MKTQLSYGLCLIAAVLTPTCFGATSPAVRSGAVRCPNIVFICADQQRMDSLSAAGNRAVKTPALDSLASRGVRFTKSYCTFPGCSPSRASQMTGRMPYELGIDRNNLGLPKDLPTLGKLFKGAGYKTAWSGKWHLPTPYPAASGNEIAGFENITPAGVSGAINPNAAEADPGTTDAAVLFLREDPREPFLLVVSLLGARDICSFDEKTPLNLGVPSDPAKLPPAPSNLNAVAVDGGGLAGKQRNPSEANWNELLWRQQLYQYYRLTERLDKSVQAIVGELKRTGLEQNTIVLFTSDHGEMAGSHRRNREMSLYEEAVKVPFILAGPGIPAKLVETNHLVSGLDILPTLCDYAGIKLPSPTSGLSLRKILDNPESSWRDAVFASLGERGGRMVRSSRYKYNVYKNQKEELFDLQADPGESKNLANDSEKAEVLEQHRKLLGKWMEWTGDPFAKPEKVSGAKPAKASGVKPAKASGAKPGKKKRSSGHAG